MNSFYKFSLLVFVTYLLEAEIVPYNYKASSFTCQDPKLSHKYEGDTVTPTYLLLSAFLLPFIVLLYLEILKKSVLSKVCKNTLKKYYRKCFVGTMFVLVITELIKTIVKEHRPHFLETCAPDANKICQNGAVIMEYNCTNSEIGHYRLTDLSKSFPSGHTSISVFVSLYCTYIIQTYLASEHCTRWATTLTKTFLIGICILWSLLCSISRIIDKQHHWWDVAGGAMLGVYAAWYAIKTQKREDKENHSKN